MSVRSKLAGAIRDAENERARLGRLVSELRGFLRRAGGRSRSGSRSRSRPKAKRKR